MLNLTVTCQVNARIWTPDSETSEPLVAKFDTIDYVRGRSPKPNLVQIHHLEASCKWVKYNVFVPHLFIYLFIPFSLPHQRSDLLIDFYARQLKIREVTQECVLRVITDLILNPYFFPKTVKFGQNKLIFFI